jgi:hypothetical protein
MSGTKLCRGGRASAWATPASRSSSARPASASSPAPRSMARSPTKPQDRMDPKTIHGSQKVAWGEKPAEMKAIGVQDMPAR